LVAAPLLEREQERFALADLVARTVAGTGGAIVIEGSAGIGKTRLVAESIDLAVRSGCTCLTARGNELERDFAFGTVRQLFEARLARLSEECRAATFAGAAAQAAPIFSSTAAPSSSQEAHSLLHGLYWLAVNLSGEGPLLLTLDDGHWADAASLRWLSYLINRLDGLPIAVVLTMRPREPGAEQEMLDRLAADPQATVLHPRSLSEQAVGALAEAVMGPTPEPQFVTACAEVTQGNPFFLSELLRALAAERIPPSDVEASRVLELATPTVGRSVMRRFASLPKEALSVARAVSVLGSAGDDRAIASLARLDDTQAGLGKEMLCDAAILGPGGREFVHPLVRAVVYSEMPASERSARHRRAAEVMHGGGVPADQTALHLLSSDPGGETWAAHVLVEAAELACSRGAPETAVTLLQRALSEGAAQPPSNHLHWQLGRAEVAARGAAGVVHMRRASAETDDPRERASILLDASRALYAQGLFVEAADTLEEGIRWAGDDAPTSSHLKGLLANVALTHLGVLTRLGGLDGVKASINARGDDALLTATVAWIRVATEPPSAVGAELARSAVAVDAEADPAIFGGGLTALAAAGYLDEAKAGWDRVVARGRRKGSIALLSFGLVMRSPVLLGLGDVRGAEADAREIIDRVVEAGTVPAERSDSFPWLLAPLIDALIERDEVGEASQAFEVSELGDDLPALLQCTYLLASLGRLRTAEGRTDEAISLLRECGRRLEVWGVENPGFASWRSDLALALAKTDQREEAVALCHQQATLAESFGVAREQAMALRAHALITGGDEGVELLRRAVGLLDATSARLDGARCLIDLGASLRRMGRRSEAREPLRHGLDVARRCGAKRLGRIAHEELIATGAKPRRLAVTGVESLTASELRICRLAAEGMTNREIAQSLFVTEKTIEGHLGNAYRKLYISSRSQLGEALGDASVVPRIWAPRSPDSPTSDPSG
jgi:DNA-binding CsgD family transcriptional regulator